MLLLVEPFGALDALTPASLQDELLSIVVATGMTGLMVTNDVSEAILLSDRSVMMTNGPSAYFGQILSIDLPRPRDWAPTILILLAVTSARFGARLQHS